MENAGRNLAENVLDVLAVYVERMQSWRVTLTLPLINASRHVLFLVSGASKADALARIDAGEPLPAALVRPTPGQVTWLIDQDARCDALFQVRRTSLVV